MLKQNNIVTLGIATNELTEISAEIASDWLSSGEGLLLDVREQVELEIEWIPGATAMPLSKLNPSAVADMGMRKIMVICQTGRRSKEAAEKLLAYGLLGVYNVKDGLLAWNAAGLNSVDQSALLI
ncbi:MAG: rhodanese-like domain-containing protein [Pseudomonadota bacterium]|nr:rhodanese-like domain-containing protein [Pseudomonadota bacterium]